MFYFNLPYDDCIDSSKILYNMMFLIKNLLISISINYFYPTFVFNNHIYCRTDRYIIMTHLKVIITLVVSLISVLNLKLKQTERTTVRLNRILTIKVRSIAGTGYSWFCDNAKQLRDDGYLIPLSLNPNDSSKDFVQDQPGLLGGAGNTLFKFIATRKRRNVRLYLTLKRPWNDSDKKTILVLVDII